MYRCAAGTLVSGAGVPRLIQAVFHIFPKEMDEAQQCAADVQDAYPGTGQQGLYPISRHLIKENRLRGIECREPQGTVHD